MLSCRLFWRHTEEFPFVKIQVFNDQSDLPIKISQVNALVKTALDFENLECDEVAIHFIGIDKMCLLHDQYFQDPSPTDCISFPMDPPATIEEPREDYRVLGEIFVCPAIALEYSTLHHRDPYQETSLYVIHGLLHLIGYDDIMPNDRKKMRQVEKKLMTHLETVHKRLYKLS